MRNAQIALLVLALLSWLGCSRRCPPTRHRTVPNGKILNTVNEHEKWLQNLMEPENNNKEDPLKCLRGKDLSLLYFREMDLRKGDLRSDDSDNPKYITILTGADFTHSKLDGTNFSNSDLSGADLTRSTLMDVDFTSCNLQDVIYEPTRGQPELQAIARAKNLDKLIFIKSKQPLFSLRKSLLDAGYLVEARQITYAIKRAEMNNAFDEDKIIPQIQYAVFWLLFDATCKWGMNPMRCYCIIFYLWLICSIYYYACLVRHQGPRRGGLWILMNGSDPQECVKQRVDRERYLSCALYFSLFNILDLGWSNFNVGRWAQRIQFTDYSYSPEGLCRCISGAESMISNYLILLWLYTYFTTPFLW